MSSPLDLPGSDLSGLSGEGGTKVDFRAYWRTIRKRWAFVVLSVIVGTAIAFVYTYRQPKVYESTCQVIIEPIVSEKSYALLEEGVYTFKVHPTASKPEIRDAVEKIFGVSVTKVNTLNRKGKRRRNRRTGTFGKRPDTKRALVTLAEGDSIELFGS